MLAVAGRQRRWTNRFLPIGNELSRMAPINVRDPDPLLARQLLVDEVARDRLRLVSRHRAAASHECKREEYGPLLKHGREKFTPSFLSPHAPIGQSARASGAVRPQPRREGAPPKRQTTPVRESSKINLTRLPRDGATDS
jgi:hypothetical protein